MTRAHDDQLEIVRPGEIDGLRRLSVAADVHVGAWRGVQLRPTGNVWGSHHAAVEGNVWLARDPQRIVLSRDPLQGAWLTF